MHFKMNSQLLIIFYFTQFVMFSHITNGFPSSPFENDDDTVDSIHGHHHSDNQEIVLFEELIQISERNEGGGNNSTATLITFSETSNDGNDGHDDDENDSSLSDEHTKQDMRTTTTTTVMPPTPSDDLIFLTKKTVKHVQEQSNDSSGDEDSLAPHSNSHSAEEEEVELTEQSEEIATDGSQPPIKPIDMSDFLALIPAAEVQSIVANYYHNDAEVQRAYAFLSSRYFADMRQHLIQIPEIKACLRFLNNSGLDVMAFLQTVSNQTAIEESKQRLTSMPIAIETTSKPTMIMMANDIENRLNSPIELANTENSLETTTATMGMVTTTKKHLNGLHGLVDSILDILPQDQILSTFFDKLETDEQFSKLIDNIGTPTFAKILSNMQNSVPLRNFIFTLHNNGIYIARIVDSLKSYFFLGTF